MNKAEQRANEAYPPTFSSGKLHAKRVQAENVDTHAPIRTIYLKGYKQAEQDLALTWEDMKTLDDIFFRVSNEMSIGDADNRIAIENYYKEVLRRFNKYKSEGQLYN